MSIYVDISAAVHRRAGLGRYAGSLARGLEKLQPGRIALFHNRERDWHPVAGLDHLPSRSVGLGYKPWRMAVWLGQLAHLGFDGLLPNAELYHATEHLLMPLRKVPTVLTVHDLIYHLFPEHHKRLNYWYLNLTMPLYCRRAHRIITISESSKRDLVDVYDVPAEKVSVVYEAADERFQTQSEKESETVLRRYGLGTPYVLHVGTLEPRKNLPRLVEALRRVRQRGVSQHLVLAGNKGWLYEPFLQDVSDELQDWIHLLGYVPDEELPSLYQAATLVALPSLYEGFGLPMLEAMACGTVVAGSNRSSLPEVGGNAAAYFDPTSVDDMADCLWRLLTDDAWRTELRSAGTRRAAQFSWSRAAQETMAVYERVISRSEASGELD